MRVSLRPPLSRDQLIERVQRELEAGRLTLLKGVDAIGAALGMSGYKARQYLAKGEIENAWQYLGRWYAINPRLQEAQPEPAPLLDYIEQEQAKEREASGQ